MSSKTKLLRLDNWLEDKMFGRPESPDLKYSLTPDELIRRFGELEKQGLEVRLTFRENNCDGQYDGEPIQISRAREVIDYVLQKGKGTANIFYESFFYFDLPRSFDIHQFTIHSRGAKATFWYGVRL